MTIDAKKPAEYLAEVPSNIALVKYWGKRDPERQWPSNDSLSMTLSAAKTLTTATPVVGEQDVILLKHKNGEFRPLPSADKALRHLAFLRREIGAQTALRITTQNTFPTGCGIASSASGLGALTLAAIAAWTESASFSDLEKAGYSLERLAFLARLGSGSACRSFFGGYCRWTAGEEPEAQSVEQLYPEGHWQLADLIVIVSSETKAVNSSAGHLTAATSPLFRPRVAGIVERMRRIEAALARRDLPSLGAEIEAEALDMHAVMMTATPSLKYLSEESIQVLTWLRQERQKQGLRAYFTIDAGPNIHVICSLSDAAQVEREIRQAFPWVSILKDQTGSRPTLTRRPLT